MKIRTRKTKGRPAKTLPRALRDYIERHGTYMGFTPKVLAHNSARALQTIKILQKDLPDRLKKLLPKMEAKAKPAKGWTLHDNVYKFCHLNPCKKEMQIIVDELAPHRKKQLQFLDMKDEIQPWLLYTHGDCGVHTDAIRAWRNQRGPPGWTMLLVLRASKPYTMRFYGHSYPAALARKAISPRSLTVRAGQALIFPSNVVHECIAARGNHRTVMNFIFKLSTRRD